MAVRAKPGIRQVTPAEKTAAGQVLSQAFMDDPLWVYLLPDRTRRERIVPRFFRLAVALGIASGGAYGAGSPMEGCAVWSVPEGGTPFRPQRFLQAGGLGGALSTLTAFPIFKPGLFSVFGQFDRMHKQYSPGPDYYLQTIGVMPSAQGKGLASKLIRPFLEEAASNGFPAYTETMTPSNVGLYEHYGFQVMEEYRVPGTDLRIWSFFKPVER